MVCEQVSALVAGVAVDDGEQEAAVPCCLCSAAVLGDVVCVDGVEVDLVVVEDEFCFAEREDGCMVCDGQRD